MTAPEITIPREALEAAARALHNIWAQEWKVQWDDLEHYDQEQFRTEARAAILAALREWPGMHVKAVLLADTVLLPLLTEKETKHV